MYLERRRRRWYAFHDIPADVHAVLGRKRFAQSLETEDRRDAVRRAAIFKVRWLTEIEQARTKSSDHVDRDALFWRKLLREASSDYEKAEIRSQIGDAAEAMADAAARMAGFGDYRDPGFAGCESACKKDPTFGVIGVQKGPLSPVG